jgi:hypothetical protein
MPSRKSVKHWRPDPKDEILEVLEYYTVDSSAWKAWPMGSPSEVRNLSNVPAELDEVIQRASKKVETVAEPWPEGTFAAVHVTDDPNVVVRMLEAGDDLMGIPLHYSRMCNGLRVSTVPDYWKRYVSSGRYEFLKTLHEESRMRLGQVLLARLDNDRSTHYITESEYEMAVNGVRRWIDHGELGGLDRIIEQPYNIDIPAMAKEHGIAKPKEPQYVDVIFHGRFLDIAERDAEEAAAELAELELKLKNVNTKEICQVLRNRGWDGVFTKSGFSTEAQLTIINTKSIIGYGDWTGSHRSKPTLGSLRDVPLPPNIDRPEMWTTAAIVQAVHDGFTFLIPFVMGEGLFSPNAYWIKGMQASANGLTVGPDHTPEIDLIDNEWIRAKTFFRPEMVPKEAWLEPPGRHGVVPVYVEIDPDTIDWNLLNRGHQIRVKRDL